MVLLVAVLSSAQVWIFPDLVGALQAFWSAHLPGELSLIPLFKTSLQARILSWKLPHLEEWNEHRRRAARWYRERLSGLPLTFQAQGDAETHVYHLFQVRTPHRDA